MSLSSFHPVVQRWFAERFQEPTEPQARGWPAIHSRQNTLIAAPTGSGKTLAAFLAAIDALLREGMQGPLPDETRVLYVSPLKALSNDVQKNLHAPLEEIRATAARMGMPEVEIRTLLRTGDTPSAERSAMTKRPPHILVTTPESLYLLLTASRARETLRTVQTVIVDEIHAVARDKRGSHLALSLERLAALTPKPPVRIGLSATQRPIEDVARFLVGGRDAACTIVDEGHARDIDLALELPSSPLEAVMAGEVWDELHERLCALIEAHRTTLVFVNTRRLAERLTARLAERLGEEAVTSHHGSLSKERRLDAEQRLKAGKLRALVATASLELGIDIGAVDLVCQIGSTRSIATLLQRVGRSGHWRGGVPRGRLFPLSRDELVECAALIAAQRRGNLDRLRIPSRPLDILAQQIVAAVACEDWDEAALFELVRGAYPYRDLPREDFDAVVQMLAEGFSGRNGRRSRHIHYDGVGKRLHGRKGARLAAITSGGAIPDNADYRVILEPSETFLGTLHEDFAIESMAGDIFQLGNASWRIRRVLPGQVRVEDAHGQPPTIPFWLGEAPARTDELSAEVSRLREDVDARLEEPAAAQAWLEAEVGLAPPAAQQIVDYLKATRDALGVVPTQKTLVLERFFDESGGMQLVLHAPFGGRINRAWGLSLRKRFCRTFNFELQAAATEDAIVLSLGPQHSFPLEEVWSYLKPGSVTHVLEQALIAAPMFEARWRWNATRSLAVLRQRNGKKTPAPLVRMQSQDLLAAVFPDQQACAENLQGEPEIPDHPLVRQTIEDCLTEAMDLAGLIRILQDITGHTPSGGVRHPQVTLLARDTTEPSPIAHEVLNAKPYAFLDDAPLEERRTQAVMTRRSLDVKSADDLGALDPQAIARVQGEAWPDPEGFDELHDALLLAGCLPDDEIANEWRPALEALVTSRRAGRIDAGPGLERPLWIAAERLPLMTAILPALKLTPALVAPERDRARAWTREDALRELVRGRLEIVGPTTIPAMAGALGLPPSDIELATLALEREGFVLRGRFRAGASDVEWCERRLLARIHRYTLDRLRREIEPVSAADFMRFLMKWQRVVGDGRAEGPTGLQAVIGLLDGFELSGAAWERDVLPARLGVYDSRWLDGLCLSGEAGWGRLTPVEQGARRSGPIRSTPIALFLREHEAAWRSLASPQAFEPVLSGPAHRVWEALGQRGASFFGELVTATGQMKTEVENGLAELVAHGLATSDSFAGLRALLTPSQRRPRLDGSSGGGPSRGGFGRGAPGPFGVANAGRWARLVPASAQPEPSSIELYARQLLARWGVVFRRLLDRESIRVPWRELLQVYRRLEARGDIRGGRFVAGFSGEQYAAPEAIGLLRQVRRDEPRGELVALSAADPLNLVGIVTPGARVTAIFTGKILYRDGLPIAVGEGGETRFLETLSLEDERASRAALGRRKVAPVLRTYLGA